MTKISFIHYLRHVQFLSLCVCVCESESFPQTLLIQSVQARVHLIITVAIISPPSQYNVYSLT